jgi:probable rRNA maturation factor
MPEVLNNQRKLKVNRKEICAFAGRLTSEIPETEGRSFTVAFVSDSRMRRLNRDFRGKDSTTDVLSFPFEPDEFDPDDNLGDIVVSAEQAARQAAENGLDLESEIRQLILHGVLHLCGYDHETDDGEMNARELELREAFKI